MDIFVFIFLTVLAYLLGSFPSAYLIVKRKQGIDIRTAGSGNVGSTNAVRVAGKKWGILVFFIDSLKGFIPAYVGMLWGGAVAAMVFAVAAVLGHMFSPWLGFRGGKGVATSIGAALAIEPWFALITFIGWLIVAVATSYVSVASCVGGVLLTVLFFVFGDSPIIGWGFLLLTVIVIIKHRSNFIKIKSGTEGHSFRKKTPTV